MRLAHRRCAIPNSYAAEADNGCVVAVFPNGEAAFPHVALHVSHLSGPDDRPVVLVARLSPDDARAFSLSLAHSADQVSPKYDEYLVDMTGDGGEDGTD